MYRGCGCSALGNCLPPQRQKRQNRREMEKLYKFVKIVNFTDYAVPCTPDVKARSELGLHCALGLRMRMLNKR